MFSHIKKLIFTSAILFISSAVFGQNKIALLVGVGAYAEETGWDQLNSTNDLVLIKDALLKQGFKEEDIVLLENQEATKEGVLNAITVNLVDKADKGSVAVFHYSGHGQQMMDDNGDELDGLDEALVPFDSQKTFEAGVYEGEKLIRDDEMGELFVQLRQKLGSEGQLLVLMDACHSGTGTRSSRRARGTDVIMASTEYKTQLQRSAKDAQRVSEVSEVTNLAPMISFFSSQAGQLSYERKGDDGKSYGLLSYSFSKLFSKATKATSYRALFDQMQRDMQTVMSAQSPQAEGELDVPLLGNQILGEANYYKVKEVIDNQILLLNAGTLLGIHEGSKIAFYPSDTRDTSNVQPYAVGTVIYADITQADIEFDVPQNMDTLQQSWAYILEKNYGEISLSVQIKPEDEAVKTYFENIFKDHALLSITDTDGEVILEYKEGESIRLISNDGFVIANFTNLNEQTGAAVTKKLLGYAQANYLRQLQINNPILSADIQVIHNGKKQNLENIPAYQSGEVIQLEITNTGQETFYFSLLDIMPDNAVTDVDLSGGKYTSEELYLEPGKTFVSTPMQVGAPYGVDVFKLVTSVQPMDLSVIRGTSTRSAKANNPFEQLLLNTNGSINTRGTTNNLPTSFEVNVETFIFEIQE